QEGFNSLFHDPWSTSDNQVGHFLTAVNLGFNPGFVSEIKPSIVALMQTPGMGSIRDALGTPPSMSDRDVALRLIIGHEKVADSMNPSNFITQYAAASAHDVEVFRRADVALGPGPKLDLHAALNVLKGDGLLGRI